MKKIVSSLCVLALAVTISAPALAHTHLTETNPADGATVTEAISTLTLQFDGQVGEGSFVELTTSTGKEVEISSIEIGDDNMTATVAEPLTNDNYTVDWSIISADGHPLQGSYTFTVDAPTVVEEDAIEPETTDTETTTEEIVDTNAADEDKSNTMTLIIAAVLVIVIISSLFVLLKRKK